MEKPITQPVKELVEKFWLTRSECAVVMGINLSTFDRLRQSTPTFPKPTRHGQRILRWSTAEILAYQETMKEPATA